MDVKLKCNECGGSLVVIPNETEVEGVELIYLQCQHCGTKRIMTVESFEQKNSTVINGTYNVFVQGSANYVSIGDNAFVSQVAVGQNIKQS